MKYLVRFTVKGFGQFPIDMLRYDRCFPDTEKDSEELLATFNTAAVWEINLAAYCRTKSWLPCNGRWNSFGCDIGNLSITKIYTY